MMKNIRGWRTIAFNASNIIVIVATAGLVYIDQIGLTGTQAGIAGLALTLFNAFANMYLRSITTTPMGQGDAETD